MATLLSINKGNSFTISFALPDGYDQDRINSIKVRIGSKVYTHTISVEGLVTCQLTSEQTALLTGLQQVVFTIDDDVFGVKVIVCGDINVRATNENYTSESVNTGNDVVVTLTLTEIAITLDDVLYDYVKGDKGDKGGTFDISQTIGDGEDVVMSQKALTDEFNQINNTSIIAGKNKFDKDNSDIVTGKYFNSTGDQITFGTWKITHYIPIKAGQTLYSNDAANSSAVYHELSDIYRNKLSMVQSSLGKAVTATEDGYLRMTLSEASVLANVQIEIGTAATTYESYGEYVNGSNLLLSVQNVDDVIPDQSVLSDKLKDADVQIEKMAFSVRGKNKFDKTDATILSGKYLNSSGDEATFGTWKITHYIPIVAGQELFCNKAANNSDVYHVLYDEGKVKLSQAQSTLGQSVTATEDGFIRFTLAESTNLDLVQVEIGNSESYYEAYRLGIGKSFIVDDTDVESDIYLPTIIPLAKERELNIYTNGLRKISDEKEKYSDVYMWCDTYRRGYQKDGRFNYSFNSYSSTTISVNAIQRTKDGINFGNKKTTTIKHLLMNNGTGTLNILAIGDSISERGINHRELQNLFFDAAAIGGANINFFGTTTNPAIGADNPHGFGTIKTECRGGWWTDNFLTEGRNEGDSMDGANPFWDGTETNFAWYIAQLNAGEYSGDPISGIDIFMITLGTNDIYKVNDLSQYIANLNSLITKMWADYPDCKIVICGIPPMGLFSSIKNTIIEWNDAIDTEFTTPRTNGTSGKLVFAPVATWIDREHGYGDTGRSRIPNEVTIVPENFDYGDLHPYKIGCEQLADAQFSGIQYVLSL